MTASTAPTPRAVVYCRVSLDKTGQGLAVDRQREDCVALASVKGWTVVDTFTDNSVSAAGKKKRPGFDAALDALDLGHADVLVAWSLDRLTRNGRDRLRLVEVGQRRNA